MGPKDKKKASSKGGCPPKERDILLHSELSLPFALKDAADSSQKTGQLAVQDR